MRRADRLFRIINLLRGHRHAVTARQLSEALEVSERTIYRDIQTLSLSNVPIDGEAGVGYRLSHHYDLPPLMFETSEVEALLFGAKMVQTWSDRQLASSANSAMQKILAILPKEIHVSEDDVQSFVPVIDPRYKAFSEEIRSAIRKKQILEIDYQREDKEFSNRRIQPLGLVFWGRVWTVIAWCELRNAYRMFRLDRIINLAETTEQFTLSAEKNIDHCLQQMGDCK